MSVMTGVRLGIDLEAGCIAADCFDFADPLHTQLSSGKYDVCATMPLPASMESWEVEHRTARKRAWRAEAKGYWASGLGGDWNDAIHAINRSRRERQGRPMAGSYRGYPNTTPIPHSPCNLHRIRGYGVWHGVPGANELVAYLIMYRAGDLALVSQVLGHGDHEENGIMYLLFRRALEVEGAIAPGVCVYNRWDSGTDGLRFLKARIGFEETPVEWLP